jgi:hypothetical protein
MWLGLRKRLDRNVFASKFNGSTCTGPDFILRSGRVVGKAEKRVGYVFKPFLALVCGTCGICGAELAPRDVFLE